MTPDPSPSRPITIYDIARQAGVSASTVSAVLNGNWKARRISAATAQRVQKSADEQGFSLNLQARALRQQRSNLIGMIMPKYDNRYFSSIAEQFEFRARAQGLFPIITCTARDPALEQQAVRTLLAHKVDCMVATGASDPDLVAAICQAAKVPVYNLDLPGSAAPSVISDNYGGAFQLTGQVLRACAEDPLSPSLAFIGGRSSDHNTAERIRGFCAAHAQRGIAVPAEMILPVGYAAERAERGLADLVARRGHVPAGIFVNSTSALEGVMRWLRLRDGVGPSPQIGSFDWDPFAQLIDPRLIMARQDVAAMLDGLFDMMAAKEQGNRCLEVPVQIMPPLVTHHDAMRRQAIG